MLAVVLSKVKPDQVDRLRAWLRELSSRHDEVLETFAQETVRHEVAYLIEGKRGPILVYAIEAEDLEQAQAVYQASTLPIDLQHRQVMSAALDGRVDAELLYECKTDGRS